MNLDFQGCRDILGASATQPDDVSNVAFPGLVASHLAPGDTLDAGTACGRKDTWQCLWTRACGSSVSVSLSISAVLALEQHESDLPRPIYLWISFQ